MKQQSVATHRHVAVVLVWTLGSTELQVGGGSGGGGVVGGGGGGGVVGGGWHLEGKVL